MCTFIKLTIAYLFVYDVIAMVCVYFMYNRTMTHNRHIIIKGNSEENNQDTNSTLSTHIIYNEYLLSTLLNYKSYQ